MNRAALLRELAGTLDCGALLKAHPSLGENGLRALLGEAAALVGGGEGRLTPPPTPRPRKRGPAGSSRSRRASSDPTSSPDSGGSDSRGKLVVSVDGASRGNPGEAGIGVMIQRQGQTVATLAKYLGVATNNAAEYEALIHGLRMAQEHLAAGGPRGVLVRSDSELLVRQMTGKYRVRHPRLIAYHAEAQRLAVACGQVTYQHVPREHNAQADVLANQAIDEKRTRRTRFDP